MKQFDNETTLEIPKVHMHPSISIICTKCRKEFSAESEVLEHMKEHDIFTSFKKALERNPRSSSKAKPKSAEPAEVNKKKKSLNCYLIFVEEHRGKLKEENQTFSSHQETQ